MLGFDPEKEFTKKFMFSLANGKIAVCKFFYEQSKIRL